MQFPPETIYYDGYEDISEEEYFRRLKEGKSKNLGKTETNSYGAVIFREAHAILKKNVEEYGTPCPDSEGLCRLASNKKEKSTT